MPPLAPEIRQESTEQPPTSSSFSGTDRSGPNSRIRARADRPKAKPSTIVGLAFRSPGRRRTGPELRICIPARNGPLSATHARNLTFEEGSCIAGKPMSLDTFTRMRRAAFFRRARFTEGRGPVTKAPWDGETFFGGGRFRSSGAQPMETKPLRRCSSRSSGTSLGLFAP